MRSFLKDDDGWLDLVVKIVTIAAFVIALHQYVYKIYPVWNKEKKLIDVSHELEKKQQMLTIVSKDLLNARKSLESKEEQLKSAELQFILAQQGKAKKERELQSEIQALLSKAEALKKEYRAEKQKISTELQVAKKNIETNNSRMVGVYLESFANDIFDIQIDNIRWSRGEDRLDLKRDIIKYSDEKLSSEKDPVKKTALQIFRLYAEKELNSGQIEYSKALMVGVFYQFNQEAKELIGSLNNAQQTN